MAHQVSENLSDFNRASTNIYVVNPSLVVIHDAHLLKCLNLLDIAPLKWTRQFEGNIAGVHYHDSAVFVVTITTIVFRAFVHSNGSRSKAEVYAFSSKLGTQTWSYCIEDFRGSCALHRGRFYYIDKDGGISSVGTDNVPTKVFGVPDGGMGSFSMSDNAEYMIYKRPVAHGGGWYAMVKFSNDSPPQTRILDIKAYRSFLVSDSGNYIVMIDQESGVALYSGVEGQDRIYIHSIHRTNQFFSSDGRFFLAQKRSYAELAYINDSKRIIEGEKMSMSANGQWIAFFRDGNLVVEPNPFLATQMAVLPLHVAEKLGQDGDHALTSRIATFLGFGP